MPRPSSRDPRTDPRALLGKHLRLGRVAAGFATQEALAAKLGYERPSVSKAEAGIRAPSNGLLRAWVDTCNLDAGLFGDLAELARAVDGRMPSEPGDWQELESRAWFISTWQPLVIPVLLQTADYARALAAAAQRGPVEADAAAEALTNRKSALEQADPANLVAVLDESVLHRLVGSPVTMYDALTSLAETSAGANVSLHVLPSDQGAAGGLFGPFTVAELDDGPGAVLTEGVQDQLTDDSEAVRKASAAFNLLRGDALARRDSLALVIEAAERWKEA